MSWYGTDADDFQGNSNFTVYYAGGGRDRIGIESYNVGLKIYGGEGSDTLYQNATGDLNAWGGSNGMPDA